MKIRVLIDDLRYFRKSLGALRAGSDMHGVDLLCRSSAEGMTTLNNLRAKDRQIWQLWLDHDLGGDDTIMPVVSMLEEYGAWDDHLNVQEIIICSANPVGAQTVLRSLTTYGYNARWSPNDSQLYVPESSQVR